MVDEVVRAFYVERCRVDEREAERYKNCLLYRYCMKKINPNNEYRDQYAGNAVQSLDGMLHFIENVLDEREDIVHRPIKNQSCRAVVEDDDEEQRKPVGLQFVAQTKPARVQEAACHIDERHGKGEHIHGKRLDRKERIRRAHIADEKERLSLQRGHRRKTRVCRREERNLDE